MEKKEFKQKVKRSCRHAEVISNSYNREKVKSRRWNECL